MKRVITSVATIAMLLGGLGIAGAVSAGAAATVVPTITLTPNTGLTNNQDITITGTGFAPNTALAGVECNGQASASAGTAGCAVAAPDLITTNASGGFTSSFYVATGTIGNGTCGTSTADALCFIAIGTESGTLLADASMAFATGPGVSVTPSTGLTNGQSVTITGSNFTPGDSVYAVECLLTATTEAGCDTSTATPISVSATGALPSTTFKVATGAIGNGTCGTTATNYASCIIEVATLTGTDRGVSTIDFVAPAVATPPAPSATRVSGTAVIGKSVAAVVIGKNFMAVSKITGGAGSKVAVTGVASTALHVKITESAHAKAGSYTLVIVFKDGKSARVKYTVK
ncbi:MAG: neocarzinostatin apoprotein domain-containing protein [Acidimicrobiales bacterium]